MARIVVDLRFSDTLDNGARRMLKNMLEERLHEALDGFCRDADCGDVTATRETTAHDLEIVHLRWWGDPERQA